jgi:hypothetical protein
MVAKMSDLKKEIIALRPFAKLSSWMLANEIIRVYEFGMLNEHFSQSEIFNFRIGNTERSSVVAIGKKAHILAKKLDPSQAEKEFVQSWSTFLIEYGHDSWATIRDIRTITHILLGNNRRKKNCCLPCSDIIFIRMTTY